MVYLPNIPQPTDIVSQSQPQLLENFQQLDTLYALDHYAWDDATVANRGHHKTAQFISQAGDPAPPPAGSGFVYTKTGATTELYYEYPTGSVISLTPGGAGSTSFQAYVTFNCASPPTVLNSLNVSSVTYGNNGIFTVNFTSAIPTANYGFTSSGVTAANGNGNYVLSYYTGPQTVKTTTQLTTCFQGGIQNTHTLVPSDGGAATAFATIGILGG